MAVSRSGCSWSDTNHAEKLGKAREAGTFRLASSMPWHVAPTFSWIHSPEQAFYYDDQSGYL